MSASNVIATWNFSIITGDWKKFHIYNHRVLVLDKASYYNAQLSPVPVLNSRESSLAEDNVHAGFIPTEYNKWFRARQLRRCKSIAEQSRNILPLTAYHKEMGLSEWLWVTVKNFVARRDLTFKMNRVIIVVGRIFSFIWTRRLWTKISWLLGSV